MFVAVIVMTMVIVIVMIIVVIMIVVIVMIIVVVMMVVIMVIVIVMTMVIVIVMIVVVIMIIMIIVIAMIVVVIMIVVDMHFSIKVLSFSPHKSWSYSSLNDKRAAIFKAPLKNTTKHAIDGVMLRFSIEVHIKSTMPFDGDDGSEVEFTCFKRFVPTTTMGTMGLGRRNGGERAQQKSQKQET